MEGKEKHSLLFLPCNSCAITLSPSGVSTAYAPSQTSMLYLEGISLAIYLYLLVFEEKQSCSQVGPRGIVVYWYTGILVGCML